MSPLTFISKPSVWLTAVSKYRGSHIFGPDFGYAYSVRKTTHADRKVGLCVWKLNSVYP
jgi:hypothetical protein